MPITRKASKRKPAAKKSPEKRPGAKSGSKVGTDLVSQPHGGAIYQGAPRNPVAGSGRPRDEVREKLVRLANGKGLPFLDSLMDGKITVRLVAKCRKCGEKGQPFTEKEISALIARISPTVDQRLKGLDQAFRYGIGTKDELDVRSHPEVQRFVMLHAKATREVAGELMYRRIIERVRELAA